MDKKIIWGGLAGGLSFFILGFLLYGLLLHDFLETQTVGGASKPIPDFPFLILGNIIMGFFYALMIGSWAKASSAADGAKKGLILGLFLGCGYDLIMFSTMNITTMTGMLTDILITVIMGTITGAVVAGVMRSSQKAATA